MPIQIRKLVLLLIMTSISAGCTKISRLLVSRGGTEFTLRVTTNKPNKEEIVELAVKIIENKLDAVDIDGEAERVSDASDQIHVKIFGDQDLERVKRFLFTTHELELKKAVSAPNPSPVTTYPTKEAAQAAARDGQEVLPFNDRDELPGNGVPEPSRFIIVETAPIVTGEDIKSAQAITRGSTDYVISFTLDKNGAEKFGQWTGRNINNYIAVVLDKSVKSTAYIRGQIFDQAQIDGRFTKESAEELAISLNSGHLPGQLTVLDERPF